MSNRKAELAGLLLGTVAGALALNWWTQSNTVKTSMIVDTGNKTSDGNPIVEVTGVGGADNGKKVQGYVLPSEPSKIKLPLTVIVKPNSDLFLQFKVGDKVVFTKMAYSANNDELSYTDSKGQVNVIWIPDLVKAALGAV